MVLEAESPLSILNALPDLSGHRVDVRLRLADDQRSADCAGLAGL